MVKIAKALIPSIDEIISHAGIMKTSFFHEGYLDV